MALHSRPRRGRHPSAAACRLARGWSRWCEPMTARGARRSTAWSRCIAPLLLALCLPGHPVLAQAPPPPRSACDAEAAQRVLHPAPAAPALEARAVWLDRQLLRWPGAPVGARYRLYHSAQGAISVAPGVPVAGVAVGAWGARNAGYLAASILALKHPDIRESYKAFRDKQSQG